MTWTRREFMTTSALAAASCAVWGCASSQKKVQMSETQAPASVLPVATPEKDYFYNNFGITREMIDQVLGKALSRGGQWGELFFEHSRQGSIKLQDGKVSSGSSEVLLGMGVRCVYEEQFGYAYTESLTLEDMLRAAEAAAAIAPNVNVGSIKERTTPEFSKFYSQEICWDVFELSQAIALLQDIEKRTRAKDPSIKKVTVSLNWYQRNVMMNTSDGVNAEDFVPRCGLSLSVVMQRGDVIQSNVSAFGTLDTLESLSSENTKPKIDTLINQTVARTAILFDAIQPKGGEMPVVLCGGNNGVMLHEAVGHGLEADYNRMGISVYATKLNQRVACPDVTIVDSGHIEKNYGALNIDDEGTPAQHTVLIEKGILKGYMHDKLSAKHYGVASTGNGRRQSYRYAPIPRMRVTMMENGPYEREELIANIKYGIYCETTTNGKVDIGVGDYAFYLRTGYLIEDGKLTAPIKNVNLTGNGPDTLSKITMVANDLGIEDPTGGCGKEEQVMSVSFGMPSVLVSSLTVGGV